MSRKSPNPTDVHVGQRIKMYRMMRNKSQSDLGDACGVSFQQVQKYENGHNRVSAGRLQQFSKLLGVPMSFFFDDQASNDSQKRSEEPELVQQFLSTRDGINLSKAFTSIDDKAMRRSIVDFVEAIVDQPISARGHK